MTNEERMLRLVLSDETLIENYDFDFHEPVTMMEAINSDNPVIAIIARVIRALNGQEDRSRQRSVYNEILNHLNRNL